MKAIDKYLKDLLLSNMDDNMSEANTMAGIKLIDAHQKLKFPKGPDDAKKEKNIKIKKKVVCISFMKLLLFFLSEQTIASMHISPNGQCIVALAIGQRQFRPNPPKRVSKFGTKTKKSSPINRVAGSRLSPFSLDARVK